MEFRAQSCVAGRDNECDKCDKSADNKRQRLQAKHLIWLGAEFQQS